MLMTGQDILVGLILMVQEEGAGFELITSAFLKSMATENIRLS